MHAPMPNAQQAIVNVIDELASETDARLEADIGQLQALRRHLAVSKDHVCKVIADFAAKDTIIRKTLEDIEHRTVLAQRAVYAAPVLPPAVPASLADHEPDITGALAQVRALAQPEPDA